jgi:hypothetical protein
MNISTCFDPQGIIIRETNESNTAQNKLANLHEVEGFKNA